MATAECFNVVVGVPFFVAGRVDILSSAFHGLLRPMDWTNHVLRLPNMNVVVRVSTIGSEFRCSIVFCIP